MTRLRIHGGRVVDPAAGRDEEVDLVIVDGHVDGFVAPSFVGDFDEIIDASRCVVGPGFIDLHCHLREPGFEDKETIATGSLAAVAGGFTTICCMPNTSPTIDTAEQVEFVLGAGRRASLARVLPIGTVTQHQEGKQLSDTSEMARAGAVAFSDDGRPVWDARLMRYALVNSLRNRRPVVNHCEDPVVADSGVMNEGVVADVLGLKGQSPAAEEIMVARDIELARVTGGRLHLAHLSTEGSVRLVRAAKRDGVAVTAEAAPHHLTLTEEWVRGRREGPLYTQASAERPYAYDTRTKVNPPLRRERDRQALVAALVEGVIDVIATDHAPHRSIDKDCTYDDAAFGISGFETALGSLLTLAARGEMPVTEVIRRLTIEPARAFGLPSGTLSVGAEADVVIIDPTRRWTVCAADFHSRGKNTPLDGIELTGRVLVTLVAGRVVYRDGTEVRPDA